MAARPPRPSSYRESRQGRSPTILTQYTPLDTTTANTASIGANAAALAALQTQVAALPAPPDLTPYALAADLAAAEGSIAANQSSLTALSASLATGLASKANQSALDTLQLEVATKSTPASVDHETPGLQQHGGHELGNSERQQCHPGQCGLELCPAHRHRSIGLGPRSQAVGARRGPKNCHGALGPAQHH